MRLRFLLFACLSVFLLNITHAQCLEITSILINACNQTSDETDNEMVAFTVGATPLNVSDIAVTWPNISFNGWCTSPSATAGLNATITNGCGFLIEPPQGLIPANADVLLITSDNVSTVDNTFAGLTDTLYVVYQCDGNNTAQFVNSPGVGTRTTFFTITGPCNQIEAVTYDIQFITNTDGERVNFDAVGNATYDNTQGCTALVGGLSANWSFTDEICDDYGIVDLSTLLSGSATPGGAWIGPRVIGTNYDPTGYLGLDSVTYSIAGTGTCLSTVDSTIVFNVVEEQTGTLNAQSCDSVFVNGTWYNTSTSFADTILGTGYACDSFANITITISSAITDSTYLTGCDSVVFNGTTYTSSIILRDTILGTPGTGSSCSQLFISEYIEGSSNNKALEIYNGTGVPVNLANYSIQRFSNGNPPSLPELTLSGVIADGDVFVVINNSSTVNPALTAASDLSSSYINHNGNDAYALLENGVIIDVFGNLGCDPGTEWTDLGDGTQNNSFYRQPNYTAGATDPPNVPCTIPSLNATNWISVDAIDDFSNLGSHTANCGSGPAPSCDSVFITNIEILSPATGTNPGNPFIICDVNDSIQLPGGAFASAAGTFNFTIPGGAANGCDSTVTTVVQTQSCANFSCTFDTVLYDSYETPGLIPGLVAGSTFHPNAQSTANPPFIGLARTGTSFFYMNFQNGYSGQVYTRTVDVCAGADFRYSFWIRQFGNGPGSDFDINIYEGVGTGGTLLFNQNIVNNGTIYNQIISPQLATTTNQVTFELITNNPGGNGNDLCLDDLVFEVCSTDSIQASGQNYCNNSAPDDLYTYVSAFAGTNGTWSGPSALANGHLGTFDPSTNAFGTYYYTASGIAACGDTIISISTANNGGQVGTISLFGCDSVQTNGTWYFTNTNLLDTIINGSANGCDSIYQTNIVVLQSVTVNNPNNPLVICASNDSVQLPDGSFANSAGTYPITYLSNASCDSIYVTVVETEICNCAFDLGPDTSLCQGESIILEASPGFDTYTWQDNSTNQTFTATTTGTYFCTTTFIDSSNNLVNNGDFEQGNTGFTTDYGPGVGGAFGLLTNPGTYAINTSPSNVHNNFFSCVDHTTGTGNLMIVNGSNTPNTNVWCQNITVTPNTDYLFSAWVISLENTNAANVSTLNFLINGTQFGTSFSPSFTACDWQQFSTTWNSGANINIQICIESDVIAGNNDYGIDDIFFTPFCNFTDSIDITVNPIPAPDLGPDLTICLGSDTLLDATTANATYLWQDGSTTTPTFTAQNAGTYFVDVTVDGCTGSDSLTLSTTPVFNQTANISICAGDSAFLENVWQTQTGVYTDNFTTASNCDSVVVTTLTVIDGTTINETISVCANELPVLVNGNLETVPGTYIDTISSNIGCDSIINVTVLEVNPLPMVSLGADTTTDEGTVITINVIGSNAGDTYTWTNDLGETFTGSSIQANAFQTSEYILTATNLFNCSETDSIIVVINPLQQTLLQIPTAFSPNGDGINEVFRIANYEDFESYTLRVYNRWGELVFDNQGYNVSWNGLYKEVAQNVGAYVYYIQAKPMNGGEEMTRSGTVTLIK